MTAFKNEIRSAIAPDLQAIKDLLETILHRLDKKGDSQLITAAEAAKLRRCKPETIRRMVRDGRLPCIRNGRRIMIEKGALF